MFRIVRTEKTREVYVDGRRIFLSTIGNTGAWGECSPEASEVEMQKCLKKWGLDETAAEPNQE